MGTGGMGTEVPSWVQGQSPGGDLGRSPQKPDKTYAYTICSGQTHFRDVFIEERPIYGVVLSGSCGVCYSPPLLRQKTHRICANLTTHPGQVGWARAHPCPTVATPL